MDDKQKISEPLLNESKFDKEKNQSILLELINNKEESSMNYIENNNDEKRYLNNYIKSPEDLKEMTRIPITSFNSSELDTIETITNSPRSFEISELIDSSKKIEKKIKREESSETIDSYESDDGPTNELIYDEETGRTISKKMIDYVLVYDEYYGNNTHKIIQKRQQYLENLQKNGVVIVKKKEKDSSLVYILIKTPFEKLLQIGEKMKVKFPIHLNDLETVDFASKKFWNRLPFALPLEIRPTMNRAYFTAPYSVDLRYKFEQFFDRRNKLDIIPSRDRCLITYEILSRTSFSKPQSKAYYYDPDETDTDIGIERLLANYTFTAAYPLHQELKEKNETLNVRQLLYKYWAKPSSWFTYQPLHLVRQYFGEKLSFYFAWLGFYCTWLILPSIAGIIVFIYGCATVFTDEPTNEICDANGIGSTIMCPLCDNENEQCKFWELKDSCVYSRITHLVDNPGTIFFSIFMAIWTILFVEFWKRYQSQKQFEWDTLEFTRKTETIRPDFETKVMGRRKNPVTGEIEPYISRLKRFKRYFFSSTVVLFMVCLVIALVFGVIFYRVSVMMALAKDNNLRKYSSWITSATAAMINLAIIVLLSKVYTWIAIKLTDMEFHRTDSMYEDALTIKMYLFQFVNYYSSIFYIAFFKGRKFTDTNSFLGYYFSEQCDQSGCFFELCIQLAIIMIGKQIINNAYEILLPIIYPPIMRIVFNKPLKEFENIKKKFGKSDDDEAEKQWEKDYKLMEWTHLTLFDEYLEMIIQFGFITLFSVCFPLGPLFAFLNNILEIRIDAFKVLRLIRRPLPKKAQDIGIWLPILTNVSRLGVITNGLIIAFTSQFIPRLVYQYFINEGSLKNYTKHTLTIKNLTEFDYKLVSNRGNYTSCSYRGSMESYYTPDQYDLREEYFHVLVARLLFLIIFEHVVFGILASLHWIPDVPKRIQDQIDRENHIMQRVQWEMKPINKPKKFKAKDKPKESSSESNENIQIDTNQNISNNNNKTKTYKTEADKLIVLN